MSTSSVATIHFESGAVATVISPHREVWIDPMNVRYEPLLIFRSARLREADGSLVGELDSAGLDLAAPRIKAGEDPEAVLRDLMA